MNKRAFGIGIIFGFLFGIGMCLGFCADHGGELMVHSPIMWLGFLIVTGVATAAMYLLLCRLANGSNVAGCENGQDAADCENHSDAADCRKAKTQIWIDWLIIFMCWIPVFLAEYPGFFVYDATDEYIQVATRTFTTHHPLLHVLMLGGSVCAGNKAFGSFNLGIALYTLFQMVVISGIMAWTISHIKRKAGWVRWICLAWYGLFPTVVMFALCSAKDTLFAGFMMVAVVGTVELLGEKTRQPGRIATQVCVQVCALVMMMLMRHNGVYAVCVYGVCCIAFCFIRQAEGRTKTKHDEDRTMTEGNEVIRSKVGRSKNALIMIGVIVISLIGYKACDMGLTYATHASDTENQEILTVPIQQIARTWSVYKDEMTNEQLETLYEVLDPQVLSHYTSNLSDPVKVDFDNSVYALNPAKYQKLWWELLREHPLSYLNAWIDTSYGYYYPCVVNVYAGHEVYTFTYTESSYFGYEVEHPGTRSSLIQPIDRFYRWLSLDDDIQRIPIISWPFSMAVLFWIFAACIAVLIYNRQYHKLCAISLPMAVWLTLLLGPTFLPRYAVFLWFLLPYVLGLVKRD